jgi:ABC-type branched-subunit amino acid transport system ATPase component
MKFAATVESSTPTSVEVANVTETALELEGVIAGYKREIEILRGVDLAVERGELAAVIGPNGAGKSTLLKAVCGVLPPHVGSVRIAGRDVRGVRPLDVVRLGVGYVPQVANVFPHLTVAENLDVGCSGLTRKAARARIEELFETFPVLGSLRRRSAGLLSGGESKLLAIARALAPHPRLLLLDEPSAALSPAGIDLIFGQIQEVNRSGTTILMVEQNARRALSMATTAWVLDLGRVRFSGPGRELLDDPQVVELYLGGLGS